VRNDPSKNKFNQKVQIHEDGTREHWRDVPGYEGYYRVSDWGRVKSVARKVRCKDPWGGMREYPVKEKIRKGVIQNNGYLMIGLLKPGASWMAGVHRLVLLTFIGPCPKGMLACHYDGNKENNRLTNLRWDTPKNNTADSIRHGVIRRGEGVTNGKLTEKDVLEIRRVCRTGKRGNTIFLCKKYGIHLTTLHSIIHRKTWKHV
jgi:hypothetical protein